MFVVGIFLISSMTLLKLHVNGTAQAAIGQANNKIISTRGGTIKWRRKVPRKCDAMHSDTGLRINSPLSEMRAELYQTTSAKPFLWNFQKDNDNVGPNVMECLSESDEVLEGVS